MRRYWKLALVLLLLTPMLVASALAEPPEKTDGFVCPVLGGKAGEKGESPKIVQIGGGDYSVIGPVVNGPVHATNQTGAGTPGGAHASPGDEDYTPIWAD